MGRGRERERERERERFSTNFIESSIYRTTSLLYLQFFILERLDIRPHFGQIQPFFSIFPLSLRRLIFFYNSVNGSHNDYCLKSDSLIEKIHSYVPDERPRALLKCKVNVMHVLCEPNFVCEKTSNLVILQ